MERLVALGVALLFVLVAATNVSAVDSCNAAGSARVVETEIDSAVSVIEWVVKPQTGTKPKTEVIYVISEAGSLYRSADQGQRWALQTQIGQVTALSLSNSTDRQWFYNVATGKAWNTRDQGLTYQSIKPGSRFTALEAHPTLPDTALALLYEDGVKNLYVTNDFGSTWRRVQTNVDQANWGQAGLDGVPEGNILALLRSSGSDSLTFARSRNYFANTDYTLTNAIASLYHKKVIFVVRRSASRGLELWSSVDGAETFSRALFPNLGALREQRYTIVDLDEGEAFVNVGLSDSDNYGTIYGSDRFDREFVQILRYNKRTTTGRVDFRRVFGLEGIYLANRFNSSDARFPQTVITFNKGADWKTLTAPKKDMNNQPIVCDGCGLQLMGRTDSTKHNQLYSNENAVGLVIANGHVAPYLRSEIRREQLSMWLSRDAGQTWSEVGRGSHTFELANHGAITLFAEDYHPITSLKYSWTQGLTQVQCSFTSDPMTVVDIATEPDNKARTFVMYGTRASKKGVLVHVDFEAVVRECTTDDFEEWSPLGDKCLLGERYAYHRRKQDSMCVVSYDHESSVRLQTCPCAEEDYECDFCFEPVGARPQMCKKICPDYDPTKEPAECLDTWFETRGYRLVPGNKCDRTSATAQALEPIQHTCASIPDDKRPDTSPSGLSGGAVFGILLVVLFILGCGLVVAAAVLATINPQFRELAQRYMPRRFQELGGGGRGFGRSPGADARPRTSAYAKVGGGGSMLDGLEDDDNSLAEDEESSSSFRLPSSMSSSSSSSSSSSAPKVGSINGSAAGDDDFDPRQ